MTESRKGKTGLEWLLREADSKPATSDGKREPAAPGSVPISGVPDPVIPDEAPAMRPSKVAPPPIVVKASFEVRYKKGSEQITAAGANLSVGGFFFETKKFLPMGDVFQAQLVFPTHANRRLAVIAEVVQTEDHGLGAKFLDVDDKDKTFLEEVIAKSAAATG